MEINKIYNENCLETMARMPDGFVDLTVTSPPYDNLREYFLDKNVVWRYTLSDTKQQEIIKELINYVIKPIQSP